MGMGRRIGDYKPHWLSITLPGSFP